MLNVTGFNLRRKLRPQEKNKQKLLTTFAGDERMGQCEMVIIE